eukprot:CAMPEP_0194193902 /NCGR_PEP_ID=MMETSP0154-20130528/75289_1 /TAXON_ID=1049557 /ORGANISM="Thalassiothrix antarctica, Strain L6-D1" /LENGTH=386 /DNA_ID=CAMNT_0038918279 /DNA_START=304 /DNA_END=1465 /DNA_ORIENTATION=-
MKSFTSLVSLYCLFSSNNGRFASAVGDDYTLPVYDVGAPICDFENVDATVDVTCNYTVIIPEELRDQDVKETIDFTIGNPPDCNGTIAGIETGNSTLTGVNSTRYEVEILVTIDELVNDTVVEFCLRTNVRDNETNIMKYNAQVVNLKFNYTSNFTLEVTPQKFNGTNETADDLGTIEFGVTAAAVTFNYTSNFTLEVTPQKFNGTNETADDLGTIEFTVTAAHCDINKNPRSASELSIDDDLYVCIKSDTTDIVVKDIMTFTLKKANDVDNYYSAITDGLADYSTFVRYKETDVVQVGTVPRASLFTDAEKIIIEGTAMVGAASGGRYLARFTQEVNNGAATAGDFELEVEVVKANSAANIAATNMFVTFYGTMIGVVATVFFFF